jgi:hypothetical protein
MGSHYKGDSFSGLPDAIIVVMSKQQNFTIILEGREQ